VNVLLLARHAHASSNEGSVVNGVPPGEGLSPQGVVEAKALGERLASTQIDLGVSSRLLRARETLEAALAGRDVRLVVEPLLDEIGFGTFEGGALEAYRAWAWTNDPTASPGGGESRVAAASRIASGLEALLRRPEETILAVSHSLPIRYVIDASDGMFPSQRVVPVPHAAPFQLDRTAVERAAETLRAWADAPMFTDAPFGG